MVESLSVVAAIAATVQTGALVALHLLPTRYNPVRDAVSDYGVGPFRAWFWAQTIAGGVAGLALGIALADSHPSKPTLVVVMLLVSAGARFLIPVFPTDQAGGRFQTPKGTIHMILAIVIFASLTVAASELAGTLEHEPAWHQVKGLVVVLPWVMTASAIGIVLALLRPRLKRIFGLIERLFYLSSIAWFFVISIELARIAT
jgi:Protein of unknown function (DUF998)